MNLVKAQAIANDLQIPDLQKYVDGFDPRVIPPWVAAGVMQEKMETAQKLANLQGAAQGEQPSVKEQIEQKAGLMALQQQMKQQSMGGMPPMGSMPVPEGAPQPEAQPEAFMAASGGLARLPVRFNFDGGGIVAFSGEGGSEVKGTYETSYDRRNRKIREADAEEAKKPLDEAARRELEQSKGDAAAMKDTLRRLAYAGYDIATLIPRGLAGAFETAVTRPLRAVGVDVPYLPDEFYGGDRSSMTPYYDKIRREDMAAAGQAPRSMQEERDRNMAIVNQQPRAGMANDPRLLGATPKTETVQAGPQAAPQAAPKAAPQAGLPGALPAGRPQGGSLRDEALQAIRGLPSTAPTPEEAVAQSNKMLPGVASEEAQRRMYEGQQKRISDLEAQYAKSRPSGLDDLIRVFGQAGQYKGLSGLGPAYTQNLEAKRADELNFQAKMNALRADTEKDEQTGARDLFGKRSDLFKTGTEQFGQNVRARAQDLTSMANTELSTQAQLQAARIAAAAREQGADDRAIKMAEDAYARDPQAKLLLEEMKSPAILMNPENPRRAEIVRELNKILASKYTQFGIKIQGTGPGAEDPGVDMTKWGKAQKVTN